MQNWVLQRLIRKISFNC